MCCWFCSVGCRLSVVGCGLWVVGCGLWVVGWLWKKIITPTHNRYIITVLLTDTRRAKSPTESIPRSPKFTFPMFHCRQSFNFLLVQVVYALGVYIILDASELICAGASTACLSDIGRALDCCKVALTLSTAVAEGVIIMRQHND